MDNNVLIILIIVAGILVAVFLLRDRITEILARVSPEKGEGEIRLKAAKPQRPQSGEQVGPPPSVDISGNFMAGKNRIDIVQQGVRVKDTKMLGENEVFVGSESHTKPAADKETK